MLTGRGLAVLGTAALLWLGSRLAGSPDLHVVSLGLLMVPLLALAYIRWSRHRLRATRRLSHRRVFAGSPVRVHLEVRNDARSPASMLLLEDRLPRALGRAARAVLGGLRPRTRQTVSYTLRCGRRGRFRIGPLVATVTDPFGLAQRRMEFPYVHELIVYPEVEDLRSLGPARSVGGTGETTARRLYRSGEEFYGMRQYELGDDLRRIHWPSTARVGDLMIRQDEAGRRATATVFLDTRRSAYRDGDRSLERAVSAAASVGTQFLRSGVDLRLATVDLRPRRVTPDAFLEALALLEASGRKSLSAGMSPLQDRSITGSSLLLVGGLPHEDDLAAILRATGSFGTKVAVLIAESHSQERIRTARVELARAEWRTVILPMDRPLRDVWTLGTGTRIGAAAGS